MLIGATSDTHGQLPDPTGWPCFDLFIHAGDIAPNPTNSTRDVEIQRAWLPELWQWLERIQARQVLLIPGNHDLWWDTPGLPAFPERVRHGSELEWPELRLAASSWTVHDPEIFPFPWAFGASESGLEQRFSSLPTGIEILVTHSPASEALDNSPSRAVRSEALGRCLAERSDISLHLHGHAHEGGGRWTTTDGRLTINAARHVMTVEFEVVRPAVATPTVLARF